MPDTPPITEPTIEPNPTTIPERIAVPLLSFSGVLFVALGLSQIFALPMLTTFTVGGVDVTVDEAIAYEKQLRADVLSLEVKRAELVLPYIDQTYDALMEEKRSTLSIAQVKESVLAAMRMVTDREGAAISVDALFVESETRMVTVRGSVTSSKPSTIAVLAAALEEVKKLPSVKDLTLPPLTREQDGDIYRSPFKFSFVLP